MLECRDYCSALTSTAVQVYLLLLLSLCVPKLGQVCRLVSKNSLQSEGFEFFPGLSAQRQFGNLVRNVFATQQLVRH